MEGVGEQTLFGLGRGVGLGGRGETLLQSDWSGDVGSKVRREGICH